MKCLGKVVMITTINNSLGYNMYGVVDIDSGHQFTAYRYQMEKTEEIAAALLPENDIFEEAVKEEAMDEVDPIAEPDASTSTEGRWADMTEDAVDKLASNRHSIHTSTQTKWAVQVFRGECIGVFSSQILSDIVD